MIPDALRAMNWQTVVVTATVLFVAELAWLLTVPEATLSPGLFVSLGMLQGIICAWLGMVTRSSDSLF